MNWIRSSWCRWDEPQCVEVTAMGRNIVMRDSKLGSESPEVVVNSRRSWRRFLEHAPHLQPAADGMYRIVDLAFTPEEWRAFVQGVEAGEFDYTRLRKLAAA